MSGIDVIGFISANCGLGVAARNTIKMLTEKGYDVSVADILLDNSRSGLDHTYDRLMVPDKGTLAHEIRLFHLNPPVIGRILDNKPPLFGGSSTFNVAIPFWELSVLPDQWISDLREMDMVLCPSRFIEQTIANTTMEPIPHIRHFPQTAFLPKQHCGDRVRFGLPEEGVCFVMSFEMTSDMERKNPWGVIDAFNGAFAPDENTWLIVKLSSSLDNTGINKQRERLRAYSAANERIIIIDQAMTYTETLSLYESCDVYVSLHRSEGFGLGLMESMLLEKPVIATAWSGNMDFMDDANACLVGYRLVPVLSPVYRSFIGDKPALWAEPSIAEAAVWMRRLYENPALRAQKGNAALIAMSRRQDNCRKAEVFSIVEQGAALKSMVTGRSGRSAPLPERGETQPVNEHAILFSAVSKLIKENDIAGALALYKRSRASLRETPELLRFDDLMRQLREKAKASVK
jgi:glycosyltransferase involved in cell wall biosynthesis